MRANPDSLLGTWSRVPSASGPGIHTDEASSAVPDLLELERTGKLRGLLSPATLKAISRMSRGVRSNPGDGLVEARDESEADTSIGYALLIPLARLVTGQWGVPAEKAKGTQRRLGTEIGPRIDEKTFVGRKRLPIVRSNPSAASVSQGQWVNEPFFARMEAMRVMLLDLEVQAHEKYDREGTVDGRVIPDDKRGWVNALRQCRGDVEWVIKQKDDAKIGTARVVERDARGAVVKVMGIDPTKAFDLRLRENPKKLTRKQLIARVKVEARPLDELSVPVGERKPWGAISAKGNQKLPFASYSTLPMSSCPGAGGCNVELDDGRKNGYCYSFTAWRYPDAFTRQFRNCLAEFTDREFAIIAGGGANTLPLDLEARVDAALAGRAVRSWHKFCRQMVERDLRSALQPVSKGGKPAFMRLYVDGDINSADNVFEWMNVCADLQLTRTAVHPGIQVYGYSKCWDQFLLLDRVRVEEIIPNGWGETVRAELSPSEYGGGRFAWPDNYTLNMSADSWWNSETVETEVSRDAAAFSRRVTVAMAALPISRGYFASVDLTKAQGWMSDVTQDFSLAVRTGANEMNNFPAPAAKDVPFPFNENRMRAILDMNVRLNVSLLKASGMSPQNAREHLVSVYRELVAAYDLGDFVKRQVSKSKATLGQSSLKLPKIELKYGKKHPKAGQEKKAWEAENALSEALLSNLYHAWFAYLYAHGESANASQLERYTSAFEGQAPMSFRDIVVRELARDEVALGEQPLSREDYVESERQDRVRRWLAPIIGKMKKFEGQGGDLADAILFVDKKAQAVASRVRSWEDVLAMVQGAKAIPGSRGKKVRLETKQLADLAKRFDPRAFARDFASIDAYQTKALAIALHEVLWTFGRGGSCPLVCGNCFDTPNPPNPKTDPQGFLLTRHRCASRQGFRDATVNIGRH